MTATLKYRDVPNDAIKLMLFSYSLEDRDRIWYEKEPPNSILTWDDLVNKFVNQFFPPSKTTHLKNEISRFTQKFDETFSKAWDLFKELLRACPHHRFLELTQIDTFYNGLTEQDQDSLNAASGVQNNQIPPSVPNEFLSYIKSNEIAIKTMQNQINVLRGDFSKYEENLRRNLNDDMRSILGSFFQNQPSTLGTLPSNTIPNPKGEMKAVTTRSGLAYERPPIPTKSLLEKVDEQNSKEILDKEHSNSSGSIARLPEKLGDPGKFLIPCDFPGIEVCHALADLRASINLMPLSIWKKLSLPKLTPTWMTLELADRSITRPKGVVEDVFVKVGKFRFPTDFFVVDFEADLRVSLILGRSFLRTGRTLIDVYGEEITLKVNDKSVIFNLDQVMRYSDNSVSHVNVINIAFEEVVQHNSKSSNPTLVSESDFCKDPIDKISPFEESDFFSEEIKDFLNDDSIPTGIENSTKSPIEEPEYSFSMGYEHFITNPVTKLYEIAESSDKNLVPIQSEYEVTSDNESESNEPINDDSFLAFTTFTNPLFNEKDDFTIHDEDVPIEESKVYSNPNFDDNDKIYYDELESHCLNVESNFAESLSNHDTLKFDHLKEFSRGLMPIHIAEEERIRREHAEYISLMEKLITINPCPRPTVNANTIVESLPSSLIPVQDNDSQREEIDIVTDTDELLPLGFENDDSKGEIYVLEELRVDNSISNSTNELSDNEVSDHDNPSFPRPPPEPPDDEFDFELNSEDVISAVMSNIKEFIDDECFDP
uniref:Reverse transcriptase domain-containing protein n=1 Tax=Tanacetum cinerariifolium TaxID=118510 RepID=A0A699H2V9_TANCI|nr:reverse transcriptase domain-containing protein [Tanacetum cinerariifolium]